MILANFAFYRGSLCWSPPMWSQSILIGDFISTCRESGIQLMMIDVDAKISRSFSTLPTIDFTKMMLSIVLTIEIVALWSRFSLLKSVRTRMTRMTRMMVRRVSTQFCEVNFSWLYLFICFWVVCVFFSTLFFSSRRTVWYDLRIEGHPESTEQNHDQIYFTGIMYFYS